MLLLLTVLMAEQVPAFCIRLTLKSVKIFFKKALKRAL
jgi:hypothetical protein